MAKQISKELNQRVARNMNKKPGTNGYVCTPGGYRAKSLVHVLGPDHLIKKGPKALVTEDMAGNRVADFPKIAVEKHALAGEGGGWITWGEWTDSTNSPIWRLETSWVVPPPPLSDSGQLIYVFNALEDQAGDDILQPVLQWGTSGAGGGSYWSVASWYVDSASHAFTTPAVRVNPGQTLIGVLSFDGTTYRSGFLGIPGTTLIAQGLSPMVLATETLEAYGVTKKTDYPNTPVTQMSKIILQLASGALATVTWQAEVMMNPLFGEHTQVVSNANPGGLLDLFY